MLLPLRVVYLLRFSCIVRWFGFGGEAAAEVATWPWNLGASMISGSVYDNPPEKTTVRLHFAPYPFVWGVEVDILDILTFNFCLLRVVSFVSFFFWADCRR